MAYDPRKVALICQGTFNTLHTGTDQKAQQERLLAIAEEIGDAGFGTVVLGQWHVHADGSVYYNDDRYYPEGTPAPPGSLDFAWILANIPAALRKAGKVTTVMLEFGGWACNDMAHMHTAEAAFKATMQEIFTKYPDIGGLDFDAEGENIYNDDTADGIVSIATWAAQQGKVVTCIPYTANDWWTTSVLEPTVTDKRTIFDWWNLQGASPYSYNDWVGYVAPSIDDAGEFIVFGFNFDGDASSPAEVQNTLAAAVGSYPALNGAIIWRYEDIVKSGHTVAEYATAMQDGLDGHTASA